jgi:hypothetical protein
MFPGIPTSLSRPPSQISANQHVPPLAYLLVMNNR